MSQNRNIVQVILPDELYEQLKKAAKSEDRKISHMLRVILKDWVRRQK